MVKEIELIRDCARSGFENMQVDEGLFLDMCSGKRTLPALRLYSWERPTLSVGYFQKIEGVFDLEEVERRGFDIVRRPTGGRAVFHHEEVTFCLVMPTENRGLWEIFRIVHEAIGAGLREGGIPAEVLPADRDKLFRDDRSPIRTASCFAAPSRFELTINGKKAAGTAQKMARGSILIHGSLPIRSTYKTLFELMVFPGEESREAAYGQAMEKMTSIEDETGRVYTFDEIAGMVIRGFSLLWGSRFVTGGNVEKK